MTPEDPNPWPDGTGSPKYEASKPILFHLRNAVAGSLCKIEADDKHLLKYFAERRRVCEEVDKMLLDRALKETGKFVRNLRKD